MKHLKIFGILLLVVVGVAIILSMVMPVKQRVERSIFIRVPVASVYEQLVKLEYFNTWSVWNRRDTAIKLTITGEDGTVGAATTWRGNLEVSGEGKMEIAFLQPYKKIVHNLYFIKPNKGRAESEFMLEEVTGGTKLTWEFDLATPRPWNIFNLFSSLDKKMGKDFEEGLLNVKTQIEMNSSVVVPKDYDVMTLNFPATSFAQVRQLVKKNDMTSFFSQHFPFIYAECEKAKITPGIPHGLFYVWDENSQELDMAAAIEVPAGTKIDNTGIQVIDIPASKAVYVNYYGAYEKLDEAYNCIKKYLIGNNLKQKAPMVEQYITDPGKEKDTAKWLTKIVFLVE